MISKKMMLEDIKEMIVLLSAFTKPYTRGEDYLNELKKKYINSETSHNKDFTAHQETMIDKISKNYKGYFDSPKVCSCGCHRTGDNDYKDGCDICGIGHDEMGKPS